jgi:hypothetical protein
LRQPTFETGCLATLVVESRLNVAARVTEEILRKFNLGTKIIVEQELFLRPVARIYASA